MAEPRTIEVPPEAAGQRLDHFIATQLEGVSRSRVQLLLDQGDVSVNGAQAKPSLKLRGGEQILITGEPHPAPLRATPQDIPLEVIFEDKHFAVVNKPAGMMVHAGAGETEDARNSNTLVNALLFRFKALSATGGDLRPGIVHRLDKDTSGLIVVAKNDAAHAALAQLFSSRQISKTYLALVQGSVERQKGTITAALSRDPIRRTRMTTRPADNARSAVSPTKSFAASIPASASSPWFASASRRAAPTRFESIWLPSAIPSSAIASTAPRLNLLIRLPHRRLLPVPRGETPSLSALGSIATSSTPPSSPLRTQSPANPLSWKPHSPMNSKHSCSALNKVEQNPSILP